MGVLQEGVTRGHGDVMVPVEPQSHIRDLGEVGLDLLTEQGDGAVLRGLEQESARSARGIQHGVGSRAVHGAGQGAHQ